MRNRTLCSCLATTGLQRLTTEFIAWTHTVYCTVQYMHSVDTHHVVLCMHMVQMGWQRGRSTALTDGEASSKIIDTYAYRYVGVHACTICMYVGMCVCTICMYFCMCMYDIQVCLYVCMYDMHICLVVCVYMYGMQVCLDCMCV